MEIPKTLDTLALNITEPEYRARPELSYSTLSTYESTGFEGLDHLFDRKESPSLTLGSVVDSIITGGADEFHRLFTVLDIRITDGGRDTCNQLLGLHLPFQSFEEIPESLVSQAAKEAGFWKADKWDKIRYREVLKTGNIADLYNASLLSDKTVIDTETYNAALEMVRALRESPSTSGYFADDEPMFSPVRRYYQLKFTAIIEGVAYRCMMDEVLVDYESKRIIPVDLKTSSKAEWNFEDSFVQWKYSIQARLYAAILRHNLDKDPYFKDFKLENYRFIVVNSRTKTPLVWEFPYTFHRGPLVDEKGNEWRDPRDIGRELRKYLDCRPQVPDGVVIDGVNVIKCLKPKEA